MIVPKALTKHIIIQKFAVRGWWFKLLNESLEPLNARLQEGALL